jgi:hypothetical protein
LRQGSVRRSGTFRQLRRAAGSQLEWRRIAGALYEEWTADALAQADTQPAWKPRSDGVFVTTPTCNDKGEWTRTVLRFSTDGKVALLQGNISPTDAIRLMISGGSARSPQPCGIKGAGVKCLIEDEGDDDGAPSTSIEGLGDGDRLDVRLARKKSGKAIHVLRFTPIDKSVLAELDEREKE